MGSNGLQFGSDGEIKVGEREINIRWRESRLPELETPDGYVMEGGLDSLLSRYLGWPAVIYFYSSAEPEVKRAAIEKKMFSHIAVVLASRYFQCVRVDIESIKNTSTRARFAPSAPTFHFVTAAGEIVKTQEGPMPAGALVQAMHDTFHSEYDDCVSPRLHAMAKNLKAQTAVGFNLAKARAKLAESIQKNADRETAARKKKVNRAQSDVTKLEAAMAQLVEQENTLLEPPAKPEKTAVEGG